MSASTIALFFLYMAGLGHAISWFVKESEDLYERIVMRMGVGLALIVVLGMLLNMLGIGIDWKIFLAASLASPALALLKKQSIFPKLDTRLNKKNIFFLAALVLFAITFYMYHTGAFTYPYLEDDDPWGYSIGVDYIATEKTAMKPEGFDFIKRFFYYMDPYPPGYSILMAVLHQTSPEMMWTLKFFNALIISLGILFFYFFIKEWMKSSEKALYATFVLFAIPSYLSHFIWSHALLITLYFPALYAIEKIRTDKRWFIPAGAVIAAILMIQPPQAIKFALAVSIYYLARAIMTKSLNKEIIYAGLLGGFVSLIWWHNKLKAMIGLHGVKAETIATQEASSGFFASLIGKLQRVFDPNSGSATRVYNFDDFFTAKSQNLINNPIGFGPIITILLFIGVGVVLYHLYTASKKEGSSQYDKYFFYGILGSAALSLINFLVFIPLMILLMFVWGVSLIWKGKLSEEKHGYKLITLLLFLLFFLGVHGKQLPLGLFPFRTWMVLSIFTAILGGEAIMFVKKLAGNKNAQKIIIAGLFIAVFFTSFTPKYAVNTAHWGAGGSWTSAEELQGYLWLKTLPVDTKVFNFFNEDRLSGLNKFTCYWCQDEYQFRQDPTRHTPEDVRNFLKSKDYEYVIVDGKFAQNVGMNETNNFAQGLIESEGFVPAHQTPGFLAFRIV